MECMVLRPGELDSVWAGHRLAHELRDSGSDPRSVLPVSASTQSQAEALGYKGGTRFGMITSPFRTFQKYRRICAIVLTGKFVSNTASLCLSGA